MARPTEGQPLHRREVHQAKRGPLANNLLLRFSLVGGVVALVAYGVYDKIPPVHESINTLGQDLSDRWNSIGGGTNKSEDGSFTNKQPPTENVISSHKFEVPPPLRPDKPESVKNGELPEIIPYIQEYRAGEIGETRFIAFPGVFTFRLEAEPPITRTFKVFNREHPEGTLVESTTPRPPSIYMQGYVLAKEKNPDGSVLIAIGISKDGDKLFFNEDIDKQGATLLDFYDGKMGGISNVIVLLKINNFADYQYPLQPSMGWSLPNQTNNKSQSTTNDPSELFTYIQIGDPVYAGGYNPPYADDKKLDDLQQNYQQKKGKISYEEARELYLALGNQNVETLQEILKDAKEGNTSLREHLEKKRYVIQANSLRFIVRNQP